MIEIKKQDDHFIFNVKDLHKLWAFKNRLTIPADHILNVHQNYETVNGWKGWRMPGTSFPGLITAGTYRKKGEKFFWDVTDISRCIIVELKYEHYSKLIIEVADPAEAMKVLMN